MTRFISNLLGRTNSQQTTLLDLQFLPQHRFQHLARAAQRQRFGADIDRSRTLVAGDQLTAVRDQLGSLVDCPGFSATTAWTRSPHCSSGTPITAHIATAGCW